MATDIKRSWFARLDLDLVEKVAATLLLFALALRLVPDAIARGAPLSIMLLLTEACVVVFLLIRRPTKDISLRPSDWLFGFGGTLAPLLVMPGSNQPVLPIALCGAMMIAGFAIQLAAKLTLRRSFGVIAANRGVKASGPYRFVRHPMYAGYLLSQIGFFLSGPTLWNFAVYTAATALNFARIVAEERTLSADPRYLEMRASVKHRLIPLVY